jgi:hypothetical protein
VTAHRPDINCSATSSSHRDRDALVRLSQGRFRSVTIPREALTITLVLVAAGGSGCGVDGPSACTLIGCTGLVIEVTGAPVQTPVTVVVTAGDGATRSTTCTSATGACPVSFPDFTPASVTIRVLTETRREIAQLL